MKIFDSHCHLDDKSFADDLDTVIERARTAGVARMMTIGVNKTTSLQAVSLAQSHSGIYASVGIHPHDVKNCSESILQDLINLAKNEKVRAWGEIGLDFNRMYSSRQDQETWLEKQLETAAELDLPMIFHERDSNGRFLEILKDQKLAVIKGVVHCFSGNRYELDQYLAMGLHIGITGILTIKSRGAQLRELVSDIPSDRLLVETDAPYLVPAPEKNRSRRNEPAFVKSVLLKLAAVRNEEPRQLAKIVWQNTCRLYGLELENEL
jgi:TatD DNase family protein